MFTHTQSLLASSKGQRHGSLARRRPHAHGTTPLPAIPCRASSRAVLRRILSPLLLSWASSTAAEMQRGCADGDSSLPVPPVLHRAGARG